MIIYKLTFFSLRNKHQPADRYDFRYPVYMYIYTYMKLQMNTVYAQRDKCIRPHRESNPAVPGLILGVRLPIPLKDHTNYSDLIIHDFTLRMMSSLKRSMCKQFIFKVN